MTVYEHIMVGANLVLATGLQRRYGWSMTVAAAAASALPDWDGLSIVFGGNAYARAHRVWGHNLLVASLLGAVVAGATYSLNDRGFFHRLAARFQSTPLKPERLGTQDRSAFAFFPLIVWILVGVVSSLSHLAVDLVYSRGPQSTPWPLQFLWPFSDRAWVYPIVSYGDLGTTAIFVIEMFVLYRWQARSQLIAGASLLLVAASRISSNPRKIAETSLALSV